VTPKKPEENKKNDSDPNKSALGKERHPAAVKTDSEGNIIAVKKKKRWK
jgi:hypothetical protein